MVNALECVNKLGWSRITIVQTKVMKWLVYLNVYTFSDVRQSRLSMVQTKVRVWT